MPTTENALPAEDPRPVYLEDIYDPRGLISKVYFRYLAFLYILSPIFIFLGVPIFLAPASDDDAPPLAENPVQQELVFYGYYLATAVLCYFFLVICINRLRMAGKSYWWLLVPGYNLWFLFLAEDATD